jgi:hypothetical protein
MSGEISLNKYLESIADDLRTFFTECADALLQLGK